MPTLRKQKKTKKTKKQHPKRNHGFKNVISYQKNLPLVVQKHMQVLPPRMKKTFVTNVSGFFAATEVNSNWSAGTNPIITGVVMDIVVNNMLYPFNPAGGLTGWIQPNRLCYSASGLLPDGYSQLINSNMYQNYVVNKFKATLTMTPNNNDSVIAVFQTLTPKYINAVGATAAYGYPSNNLAFTQMLNDPTSKQILFNSNATKPATLGVAIDLNKIFGLTKSERKVVELLSSAYNPAGGLPSVSNRNFAYNEAPTNQDIVVGQFVIYSQDGVPNASAISYQLQCEWECELFNLAIDTVAID